MFSQWLSNWVIPCWWWWWWFMSYGNFCEHGRLNGPNGRQRWWSEVKDETPFRYAHIEIQTQVAVICDPTHYLLNHGGSWVIPCVHMRVCMSDMGNCNSNSNSNSNDYIFYSNSNSESHFESNSNCDCNSNSNPLLLCYYILSDTILFARYVIAPLNITVTWLAAQSNCHL